MGDPLKEKAQIIGVGEDGVLSMSLKAMRLMQDAERLFGPAEAIEARSEETDPAGCREAIRPDAFLSEFQRGGEDLTRSIPWHRRSKSWSILPSA